ncbi:MAG TPA: hypothetical protein DG048_20765 [Pseudoalteromonas sp.]|nr:hypothetical protein [Pseudoalteromonas sp.]|tara:strand:+ start:2672 stop:3205 length:534 start_codon:yes stop_codon:yes gene_type:complete
MNQVFLQSTKTIMDPSTPPAGIKLIAKVEDHLNYTGRYYSFFKQDRYLSICCHRIIKPKDGPEFQITSQFDAPLETLPWFIDTLNFFQKMPHEGGLPHGQIMTDKESVAGEQITICRLVNAGTPSGEGGYQINNFSREDRDVLGTWQQESFADSLLFDGGLLDIWRTLAEKYRRNEL